MRRSLRRCLGAAAAAALVPVLIASWQAYQVRAEMQTVELQLRQVATSFDGENVPDELPNLAPTMQLLDQAVGRTKSASWSLSELVPVLGGNFRTIRNVAEAGQTVGLQAIPDLLQALAVAQSGRLIHGSQIDLQQIGLLHANVAKASTSAQKAQRLLRHRSKFLLPAVGNGADRAERKVAGAARSLEAAEGALRISSGMLGRDGPRRYLLVVQNNAEARATGGLIGAYGILRVVGGHLWMERTGVNSELKNSRMDVPSQPEAAEIWKTLGSNNAWYDANYTPHFPDAANNFAGLWAAQTGERVDGVLAIDPILMSELFRVAGSITMTGGKKITADNVVAFVGRDEYLMYPDPAARKQVLRRLADQLFAAVTSSTQPKLAFSALRRGSQSGHMFLWSRHPEEQGVIAKGALGGALPTTKLPFLMILTQNFGGNKLDFYLHRRVKVTRISDQSIVVTVTLRNSVPDGLPPYITVRSDRPPFVVPYGQAKVGFSVYGAKSSEVASVTLDGRTVGMAFDSDHGLRSGTCIFELPRNKDVTVRILMSEPDGQLLYRPQPLVRPDALDLRVRSRVGVI